MTAGHRAFLLTLCGLLVLACSPRILAQDAPDQEAPDQDALAEETLAEDDGEGAQATRGHNFRNGRLYIGGGEALTASDTQNGDAPWLIGYRTQPNAGGQSIGFEVSGEGTVLDSTWGRTTPVAEQAISFNFLAARQIETLSTETLGVELGIVVGLRAKEATCPASSLGFRCYADLDPDLTLAFTRGFAGFVDLGGAHLGLRHTDASSQLIVGIDL